jgi:hypothetical protein
MDKDISKIGDNDKLEKITFTNKEGNIPELTLV